jgi:acyl-CoA thioesterase FadM
MFPRMAPCSSDGRPVAETRTTVRSPELDSFGHVNHAMFLNYRDRLPRRGHARSGDELLVRTCAEAFRCTSVALAQEIVRADDRGAGLVRARVTAVGVGPDRRPMRLPAEVRDRLSGRGGG